MPASGRRGRVSRRSRKIRFWRAREGLGPASVVNQRLGASPRSSRVALHAVASTPEFAHLPSTCYHCEFPSEGFPSGQREQTVNLPALPSKVRILPPPPT